MTARLDALLLVLAAAWTATVIAAPVVGVPAIYAAAATVCHQLPERSFHFAGGPIAVCARCLGLYVGGLAGLLAGSRFTVTRAPAALLQPAGARALVVLAAVPTAATLVAEWWIGWAVGNVTRFLAALPLGAAAAFVVAGAVARDQASRDA